MDEDVLMSMDHVELLVCYLHSHLSMASIYANVVPNHAVLQVVAAFVGFCMHQDNQ